MSRGTAPRARGRQRHEPEPLAHLGIPPEIMTSFELRARRDATKGQRRRRARDVRRGDLRRLSLQGDRGDHPAGGRTADAGNTGCFGNVPRRCVCDRGGRGLFAGRAPARHGGLEGARSWPRPGTSTRCSSSWSPTTSLEMGRRTVMLAKDLGERVAVIANKVRRGRRGGGSPEVRPRQRHRGDRGRSPSTTASARRSACHRAPLDSDPHAGAMKAIAELARGCSTRRSSFPAGDGSAADGVPACTVAGRSTGRDGEAG